MKVKVEMEDFVISNMNIIVTTCMSSNSRRLLQCNFTKVIVDEAA